MSGQVGPIKGAYRRSAGHVIVAKPCEYTIIHVDSLFQKGRVVIIHGDEKGDEKISEYVIGANE